MVRTFDTSSGEDPNPGFTGPDGGDRVIGGV
jgi:hypothetical protein